jgi:MFS transporter, Spinster family, sphingosine-1-phosphate transporter
MTDRGAIRTVAALAGLNVLSYVDRQLLVALAPLLMADLGLTRAQIGLLVGASFIVVFALGTLVLGALADRVSRPRLMAGGLAAWSAATALTGTAGGFASLAVWRALVGTGEATLPPSALSMLGDRVPRSRLGLANGVFYAGIPVGFALSFALAGSVAPRLGWRACFFLLGAVGFAGVGFLWRMADPPRRGVSQPKPPGLALTVRRLRQALQERPALPLLVLGGALLVYASASSQHAITWLVHERGFPYARAAFLSAIVTATAGLAGNIGIGLATDRAHRRHPAGRLLALAALGAVGLAAAAAFYRLPPASAFFLPCWGLAQAWMLGWFGPLMAALDEMSPAGLRATVVGFALLVAYVLGFGAGPYVTGLVGDRAGLTAGLSGSLVPGAVGVALVGLLGVGQLRSTRLSSRGTPVGPVPRDPP